MKRTRLIFISRSGAENAPEMGKLLFLILSYIELNHKGIDLGIYLDRYSSQHRTLGAAVMLLHPAGLPDSIWDGIKGFASGVKEALGL